MRISGFFHKTKNAKINVGLFSALFFMFGYGAALADMGINIFPISAGWRVQDSSNVESQQTLQRLGNGKKMRENLPENAEETPARENLPENAEETPADDANNGVQTPKTEITETPIENLPEIGEACKNMDLPQFATAGVYINNGVSVVCAATECKSGTYLVLNSSGVSQGWCVASTYCTNDGEHLNIIDGTKTDLQCVSDANNENNNTNVNAPGASNGAGTENTPETEITETPVDTESTCDLTIQVTDQNGTPISDATVTYGKKTYTTDDNGSATIEGIQTHTEFQINISHTDFKSTTYSDEQMDSCPDEPVKIFLSAAGDTDTPQSPPQNNGDDNNDPDPTEPDVDLESQRQIDQARINELQENADAMREREQSLANRMIGGASMGAMGIGGMQVASALAEQSADDAAELDMTAYLATFRCDYGAGQNIRGGETNITLPGANILLPLYNEYTTLAADLKSRKESLGMAPGIESETILDATLYDNESIGITDGAYTSLSRALSNPTGADAAEWAAQRAETAEQLKTGAIVAGVGAAVGIAGNILTNYVGDQPRERSAEINAKYDALTELHDNTVALPANVPTTCPNNATGTYPNCQCTDNNHVYNGNLNQCDKCPGNKIPDENGTQCICPSGTFPDNDDNDTCKKLPTGVSPKCNPTYKSHMYINPSTGECSCLDGFQPNDQNNLTQCICPDGYKIKENKCIEDTTPVVQTPTEITIPAENLFELDSAELTDAAKNELEKFVRKFQTEIGKTSEYCITIIGHTDKSGDHLNINQPLSEKRANAVKTALESAGLEPANMRASGVGSTECETTNPKGVDSACRKVEISATNSSCTDND